MAVELLSVGFHGVAQVAVLGYFIEHCVFLVLGGTQSDVRLL